MDRGLLWLLVGLLGLVAAVLLVAPELLAAPGRGAQLLVVVLAAGVPGLAAVVWLASRRRGRGRSGGDHEETGEVGR